MSDTEVLFGDHIDPDTGLIDFDAYCEAVDTVVWIAEHEN